MLGRPHKAVLKETTPALDQGGFTLIEVLIAVLLLSIGLLGLAALQTASLNNNSSAMIRSQANLIAYDILDRMRANTSAATQGDYQIGLSASAPTGTTRADLDLQAWKAEVATLPGGDGAVATKAATNGNTVTAWVIVRWADQADKTLGLIKQGASTPVAACPKFGSPASDQQQICFRTEL